MKKGQIIGLAIGTAGLAAVVYFGFIKKFAGLTQWQKLMGKKPEEAKEDEVKEKEKEKESDYIPPKVESGFPIQLDSHNVNVKSLQDALINKWKEKINGAPSDYLGKNTLQALRNIGYGVPVSKKDYDNILSGVKKGTAITNGFKKGELVYSTKDGMGLFSKPVVETQYLKALTKRFDWIGTYDSATSDYPGWSKIVVGNTFRNTKGELVPAKWTGFAKTNMLTNKKP